MVRPPRERGSALVEAALALPVLLTVLLCLLQLLLVQQARLLTEFAAYQAARAGIVWNGDPSRMEEAARFVLAPLACPSRELAASLLCRASAAGSRARHAAGFAALSLLSEDGRFPGVHVHILSPHWPSHGHLFSADGELEFDVFDGPPDLHEANVLTVQVQHWYELTLPFADRIVGGALEVLRDARPRALDLHRGEYEPFSDEALEEARRERRRGRFFLPLHATRSMRMQSAFFARFVDGCACGRGQGCSTSCRAF